MRNPTEATDILSKEKRFFRFKTSSYGLFESNYNTNVILPLPLSMSELKNNDLQNITNKLNMIKENQHLEKTIQK